MNVLKRKLRTVSRRALSVFLTLALFVTAFAGTLAGVFVSLAGNPASVKALNRQSVVQTINMLPVDPSATQTRTTLQAKGTNSSGVNGNDLTKNVAGITVNKDDSVDFSVTKDTWLGNNSGHTTTSYIESFTVVGQKINLAENPWLMVRWSGSGRCNGRVYFTITREGVEYGLGGALISNTNPEKNNGVLVSNPYDFTSDATSLANSWLDTGNNKRPFSIPLSNIINNNNSGYHYSNTTQTDFNAGVLHDYTIDFYEYLKGQSLYASYFPTGSQWKDPTKNYITVYMSCTIMASEAKTALKTGTSIRWEQFALGREVMNRPASLLPRSVEYMNILDTSGNSVTYGRVSATGDGAVTFLNTSTSKSVKFKWNLRRYFNATELEALNINATYTNMTDTTWDMSTWYGGTVVTYIEPTKYNYRGTKPTMQRLLSQDTTQHEHIYVRNKTVTPFTDSTGGSIEATIDFHRFLEDTSRSMQGEDKYKDYDIFFPTDSLIFIADVELTIPANGKITFDKLEFQVENEEIPATEANSVYPWASAEAPIGLPPVGTPAYSTALNGATGTSYDWATSSTKAPLVKSKIDLLSMKTYSFNEWTDAQIDAATDSTDVPYTRYSDGSSVYSSNGQTDNTYYNLMRFGASDKWNRNYYTYIDTKTTKYLYYSYEITDTNTSDNTDAAAGFYFHFQNSCRDRYAHVDQDGTTVTGLPYAYQYYLDHSGIGLNECSSMFYLGYKGSGAAEYKYGSNAILSTAKARTGVLDISSLWVEGESDKEENGQYLKLENMRIFLAKNTEIKIHYFFIGSASLDDSVKGSLVNEGGDAVPWSVSKADFDKWTDPDSSSRQFTFANKVDVLRTIRDRASYSNSPAPLNKAFPGDRETHSDTPAAQKNSVVTNADGSVTITVNKKTVTADEKQAFATDPYKKEAVSKGKVLTDYNGAYLAQAGTSYDHVWKVQVADEGDLSSMRYLHYSVDAPAGMRWSVVFHVHPESDVEQRAIMTWCDSDARWNDDLITTSAPAGKSYFRMSSSGDYKGMNAASDGKAEYDTYWRDENNTSWRIYSIPGSQSGCIDLQQVNEVFEWHNIIGIYLIAYRDPRMVLTGTDTPSVTFNYLYLTSTPIATGAEGKPAVTSGTSYNWGGKKISSPSGVTTKNYFKGVYTLPDESIGSDLTFLDYYPRGRVDHIMVANEKARFTKVNGSGSHWVEGKNSLVIASTNAYRLEVDFDNPYQFNLTNLNDLHFKITAAAPFKIAMKYKDATSTDDDPTTTSKNEETNVAWLNSTPDTALTNAFGTGNVSGTDRIKAGTYSVKVDLASAIALAQESTTYLDKLIVLFDGGGTSSAPAKMTMQMYSQASSINVNLNSTPYLYYGYRLIDKSTGKTVTTITDDNKGSYDTLGQAPLRVGMSIFENSTYYYFRTEAGTDSSSGRGDDAFNSALAAVHGYNYGFAGPSFVRLSTNANVTSGVNYSKQIYYTYGAETGCIDLREYFVDHSDGSVPLNCIRFYLKSSVYTSDQYEFVLDYLFLGSKSSASAPSMNRTYTGSLKAAPTADAFRNNVVTGGTTVSTSGKTMSLTVDLEKTPYLFYSAELPTNATGTFGLTTNTSAAGSTKFFRNAGRNDGTLISAGTPTASTALTPSPHYMVQSETGCIDVRAWYRTNGVTQNIITVNSLDVYGCTIKFHYLYFGAKADKTIDMIPKKAAGLLENGLPTRTWIVPDPSTNARELVDGGDSQWDTFSTAPANGNPNPYTNVKYKGDLMNDNFNDVWINCTKWSQVYLRYGSITGTGGSGTFAYCTTGNNQMSGLMVDLNETPYLHFSFEQPETSRTSLMIQTKNHTAVKDMIGKPANEVRPWMSTYCPTSPAGQLINTMTDTSAISYYKEAQMDRTVYVSGNHSGVIDLRSWYTKTNGYSNVISIDSVRFYSHTATGDYPTGTDVKINHLYLSSSASAAYSVTFHTNKNDGNDRSYTQYVLKNANKQYVSDKAVRDANFHIRSNYTFVGWYTDPECTEYFDIDGTPLNGNVHLYARWIDNSKVVPKPGTTVSEINFLSYMQESAAKVEQGSGNGTVVFDDEALNITNTDTKPFAITFPIDCVYNIEQLRSLFVGFDIDKTNGGYTNGEYQGFDIRLNAQSVTPQSFSLVGNAFSHDFLTDSGLLTAAPYDRECALYTYLGVRDELPAVENEGNLFEVQSITVVVPSGVSAEIRYAKAANAMALQGNLDTSAPVSLAPTFDLLENNNNDPTFVQTQGDIVYDTMTSKSMTFDSSHSYTQAAIHGISDGYAHIGGLYNYTIDILNGGDATPHLYLSVDQPEDSNFTFAIYASFDGIVEGDTAGKQTDLVYDVYTPKSVSVYSAKKNSLAEKDYNTDITSYIPADELYFQGDKIIKINLFDWYKDALTPYRSNNTIYRVKILGIRFFTDDRTTDATINYMFIGGKEDSKSAELHECYMEYPYKYGHKAHGPSDYVNYRYSFGNTYKRGETLYASVEDLANIPSGAAKTLYNDPTKQFLGWVFSDAAINSGYTDAQLKDHMVWWNPNATNGNQYHATNNPQGSWSLTQVDGFIQNQKSVFYNFYFDEVVNTQIITPVFASATYTPTVKATVNGAAATAVSVVSNTHTAVSGQTNTWTVPFGSTMILRATGSKFLGWYDDGVLVSKTADYYLYVTQDVDVEARFGSGIVAASPLYTPQSGRTIVWLQSENGTAGTNFKLQSVSGGDIQYHSMSGKKYTATTDSNGNVTYPVSTATSVGHMMKSNIADTTGNKQIACYWNVSDSQIFKAIAPSGYHWEHMLSDGSLVRVSETNEYVFVASTNIRLVAVADSGTYTGSIVIDEYVFDDHRSDANLRINGQVLCADNEEVVSCGMVFTDYKGHRELPHYNCDASTAVTAKSWNSSTGQFLVVFSVADSPEYVIRGFAIVRNRDTGLYDVRYSETVTTVF